jgi:hypothetical protein
MGVVGGHFRAITEGRGWAALTVSEWDFSALVLDLPRLSAGSAVLDSAAAELTERGIVGWERLGLLTG